MIPLPKPNSHKAVRMVLESEARPFTIEELTSRATELTGRALSKKSLQVIISNLRSAGYRITRGPTYMLER